MDKLRWHYRAWRYRLRVERQEILSLLQNMHRGDTVVDIGAHKGAYTYWMRRQVGPTGQVFAFEPQRELADKLQNLVSSSGYKNVVVENLGLSASSGSMSLNVPGGKASPSASFENILADEEPAQAVSVEVTTLDQYFADHPVGAIRLIKCDVEGHELEVFRGAEGLLSSQHPHLLFECEWRHRKSGTVDEVFKWLQNIGYQGYFLSNDGLRDIDEFDQAVHQSDPGSRDYAYNISNSIAGMAAAGSGGWRQALNSRRRPTLHPRCQATMASFSPDTRRDWRRPLRWVRSSIGANPISSARDS